MTFAGTTHQFLGDVLPSDMRAEIFRLVHGAWRKVRTAHHARLEPRITGLLQMAMIDQQEKRFAEPPFHISEDIKKRDPRTGIERERSDLQIHLRRNWIKGQKPYFVFESKRLNISYGSAVSSNANEYVGGGGMECLLAGGYDVVRNYSGMIGFVMDDKVAAAKKSVELQLSKKSQRLFVAGHAKIHRSPLMPKSTPHGETHHRAGTETHSIFHMFLGVRR